MQRSLWRWYLLAGVVALGVFTVLPEGLPGDTAYAVIGLSSVGAIWTGQRIHVPQRRAPWRLMAFGQLLWVAGDGIDSWYQDVDHTSPYPSLADVLYLSAYPVIALGLLLLIKGRLDDRRDLGGWIDSATMTAGLGLLSWVLLARPTLEASQYSWAAAVVGVAYPVSDILLVGLLIRLVTTSGGRTPAFRWLLSAIALLIAGDTAYTALSLASTSNSQSLDYLWLGAYLAWGVSALHPSMVSLSHASASEARLTGRRLTALTVASLAAPATLGVEHLMRQRVDIWAFVVSSAVLFSLVVGRMAVSIRDIVAANAQREQLQHSLTHQASHDALTGLPNRAQALRETDSALSRSQRTGALLGILFIDLDGFKVVNDSLGHQAGDAVLRVVASRLRGSVRAGDLVARFGGDEFVVLLESLGSEPEALQIAQRIIEAIREPIPAVADRYATVGASIGVALAQDGQTDVERLLHEADIAAYRAKRGGRGRYEVFDQTLRHELADRADLEVALSAAIANDDLVAHYQPIICLADGRVTGYEALVRWQPPGRDLLMPDVFIPLAENCNLICELDTWVLRHATVTLAQHNYHEGHRQNIAVNISGHHICQPRIVDDVRDALSRSGLDPNQLILEITETVLIDDLVAVTHLRELRQLGVIISIDDFGTGYNSITRLQHLPVDIIKIDRSFLDTTQDPSLALLRLMIHTAHAFGLPVIAEGVEHQNQLDLLKSLECEEVQGYLVGKPRAELITERETTTTVRS